MYGQSIAKTSDRSDLLTDANTINALNLFLFELLNRKDELTELHKYRFQR